MTFINMAAREQYKSTQLLGHSLLWWVCLPVWRHPSIIKQYTLRSAINAPSLFTTYSSTNVRHWKDIKEKCTAEAERVCVCVFDQSPCSKTQLSHTLGWGHLLAGWRCVTWGCIHKHHLSCVYIQAAVKWPLWAPSVVMWFPSCFNRMLSSNVLFCVEHCSGSIKTETVE